LDPGYASGAQDKVLIGDFDGDGQTETLFNYLPAKGSGSGSLMCFEQRGRLRWTFAYGGPKSLLGVALEPLYDGRFVKPVKAPGETLILVVANHAFRSASQAALVDPKTGRMVEEYWHPGAINQCLITDGDNDGLEELLLGGLDNPGTGLGHNGLAVLKIPFSRAPRPDKVEGPFEAVMGGGELTYLLFPLADVSRATGQSPAMAGLSLDGQKRIRVELSLAENEGVVYYLDSHFHVLDCRVTGRFAAMHDLLRRQGLLDHPLRDSEIASFDKVVAFPAAPNGNSPELNRLWKD
jgi:hypothetical protein